MKTYVCHVIPITLSVFAACSGNNLNVGNLESDAGAQDGASAAGGTIGGTGGSVGPVQCEYQGTMYNVGEKRPGACNCSCDAQAGKFVCIQLMCSDGGASSTSGTNTNGGATSGTGGTGGLQGSSAGAGSAGGPGGSLGSAGAYGGGSTSDAGDVSAADASKNELFCAADSDCILCEYPSVCSFPICCTEADAINRTTCSDNYDFWMNKCPSDLRIFCAVGCNDTKLPRPVCRQGLCTKVPYEEPLPG